MPETPFRIVAWNIRAGGGARVGAIADQIAAWGADLVALSEFRAGASGDALKGLLAERGLVHQRCASAEVGPARNAVLVASRRPMRRRRLVVAPVEPGRWCCVTVSAPRPFTLGAVHIPNQIPGRKPHYHEALLALAQGWGRAPAVIVGDTNSGKIGVDEERPVFNRATHGWMEAMEAAGFADLFRHHHGDKREFTWHSPNGGNGFRLDQAFGNPRFTSWIQDVTHVWGGDGSRRDALSDHAALILNGVMP